MGLAGIGLQQLGLGQDDGHAATRALGILSWRPTTGMAGFGPGRDAVESGLQLMSEKTATNNSTDKSAFTGSKELEVPGMQVPRPSSGKLDDTFPANLQPATGIPFTYVDKDGDSVTRKWTISDEEFTDSKALTQEQITAICNRENPELVKRGFDKAIYDYSQKIGINPKVLLATLAQEQGWCRNGEYGKAFGVGPGGEPGFFEDGGLAKATETYIEHFNDGKSYKGNIPEGTYNQDADEKKERSAVLGSGTAAWEARYPQYARYIDEGIELKPVNAAMYSRLKYTPWVDFPPQGSQPLMTWHDIFRSF